MKTIEELLKNLARPEVLEFGLVTHRLPSVNIGGKFEPIDDEAPSTERLMQMLVTMGGARYVDTLNEKPVQWTTRLGGVGVIAVAAIMRKDVIQARFTVAKREGPPMTERGYVPGAPAAHAPEQALSTRPQESRPVPASSPEPAALKPAQPVPVKEHALPPVGMRPSSIAAGTAGGSNHRHVIHFEAPPGAASARTELSVEWSDDWDDDDEPTLQTLSPPVSGAPGAISRPLVAVVAAQPMGLGGEDPSAHEKARQGAHANAREPSAPTQDGAPHEGPAQARATVEQVAAETMAGERAASERTAQEAAQERGEQERAARERVTQERVARERAALERAKSVPPGPAMSSRRILTPTSVDAVALRPRTGARIPPLTLDIDLDDDGVESAMPVPSLPPTAVNRAPAAGQVVSKASPDAIREKDLPRVSASAGVDSLLALAVAARASDLYIVAGRPVLLRIATDLLARAQSMLPEHVERIVKEIVPPHLRETLEKEGSCGFAIEHPAHGRFRVHVSTQRTGYKLNLRVIPKELPTLAGLGLPEAVQAGLGQHQGLILVTGPASHGKSTTLAALVDHLNRETARHIVTIEDPIEHIHPRKRGLVSQRHVGLHARTRSSALETALRMDADTIVIDEISDAESIRHALVACESGRLVLGTINMPSAAKAIEHILECFSPAEARWARTSLASSLRLVIGQRLVPSADRTRLHAAIELLPWSVALCTMIREGRTDEIGEFQERGAVVGAVRLNDSLAELARARKITAEVAAEFADGPVADRGARGAASGTADAGEG